jgi:hypothetical protein
LRLHRPLVRLGTSRGGGPEGGGGPYVRPGGQRTVDFAILEIERLWKLGLGGWWDLDESDQRRLLGWWYAYSEQDVIEEAKVAEAKKAAEAKKPKKPRVIGR